MVHPISWVFLFAVSLIGGAAGGAIVLFWDQIKAWAINTIPRLLNAVDPFIEKAASALIYLIQEGRNYLKKAVIYTANYSTGQTYAYQEKIPVNPSEIPVEVRGELGLSNNYQNREVLVMKGTPQA